MIRRYALDALVVVVAFVCCLMAYEAYQTWAKVNALWNVAIQNAQAQQAAQMRQQPPEPPTVPNEKRGK